MILFFMGQMAVFFKIFDKIEVKFIYCVFSFIMIFLCLLWIKRYEFLLDNWLHNPFGDGINPPGITLIIYSVCIVGFLYLFFTLIQRCSNPLVVIIYDFFSGIGKHSLYIFLYHRLILDRLLVPVQSPMPSISHSAEFWSYFFYFICYAAVGACEAAGRLPYSCGTRQYG